MAKKIKANAPTATSGKQYHLETGPNDLAAHCLLVGAPERATMIAERYFKDARLVGDHRGLRSYTGIYKDVLMSVVTTGMGSATNGIVLPEAVRSRLYNILCKWDDMNIFIQSNPIDTYENIVV